MNLPRTSVLLAPVVILLLFGTALVGQQRLAFRDVSHFYTPLYQYVAERTSEEWLPLWNPLDQTGIPLLGETTTAVLYPIRYLLFSLPIAAETALAWYVVVHLILASLAANWAATQAGASRGAAAVAGVIYPLSGSVFFLYTNPPFLVGAAWLPLVLAALITREPLAVSTRCLIGGPAMAMMILGGDPQIALHAMLVGVVVGVVRCWNVREKVFCQSTLLTLAAVPLLAAALTAPQLAASLSWSSQSERVKSVDEQSWYRPPIQGSQRSDAFAFSLPPWHLLELLIPNAFGELFPQNRRISVLIPGDGRMWTPSIYLGLLSALAIACALARRRFDAWLAIAVVSFTLCCGHFGIVWLLQQIPGMLPGVDSAIGGPYWWLYHCLPGYDSFRYPTKWLPIFSLAAAIVTANWMESIDWRLTRRAILTTGSLMILGAVCLQICRWQLGPEPSRRDAYWGPLDVDGGLVQIQRSILPSFVCLLALALILRNWAQSKRERWLLLLVAVVAIDLGWSNHRWLAVSSRTEERSLLATYRQANPIPAANRWIRTQSDGAWPTIWQQTSDPNRLLTVTLSERLAWFGRWHLQSRAAVINNMTSIQSHEMAMFWQACGLAIAGKPAAEGQHFWQSVRRWLSIDGVLTTSPGAFEAPLVDVTYATQPNAAAPFRFSTRWSVDRERNLDSFVRLLRSVDSSDGLPLPVIQSSQGPNIASPADSELAHELAVINQQELRIKTDQAGILTRTVFQDGNWTADIKPATSGAWQVMPVARVSFLQQGVFLPPGDWLVRFRYRPRWLGWTLAASMIAWVSLGFITAARCSGMRKRSAS